METESDNLTPVLTWLAEATLRNKPVDSIVAGACERLNALGYDIARSHVSTSALHPLVESYMMTWQPGQPVQHLDVPHGFSPTPGWLDSPLYHMLTRRELFMRRLLIERQDEFEFPVFAEFAAAGMTDWMAVAEGFSQSSDNVPGGEFGIIVSWTTRAPRGFRQDRIGGLRLVAKSLAVAIKSNFMTDIARDVLGAYLGEDASRRVLSGAITRGGVTQMPAVVMMADIKGFTRLSMERPIADVVSLLNGVFDIVSTAVTGNGGTILKLMGDGVLAIFLLDARQPGSAADDALNAALAIQSAMPPDVGIDIGLSIGDVHYGNIGAASRLDFTAIGPAVNEAARLEALCGALGERILLSADVAATAVGFANRLTPLGDHALKGFDRLRPVFGFKRPGL